MNLRLVPLLLPLSMTCFMCAAPGPPVEKTTLLPRPAVQWADSVLATMTLEEKAGQLLMVGAYGYYLSTESDEYARLVRLVRQSNVGGFVMWQSDVYEAAAMFNRLQSQAKVPLLIGADLERGLAMRVRRGTSFPDAMAIGATRNPGYAYRTGRAIAEEARALGIHQNYAPVVDINTNPSNPVINTRSFGDEPSLVNSMVGAFIKGTNDAGLISTAKHFPGHGDTGVDSHLELPVLPFDRARLDTVELAAFKTAVDSGVTSVMVAHIAVPALGSQNDIPASLSPEAIQGVLKGELNFKGLVVTDAMDMRGVVRGFSVAQSTVMAVKAGVDIVLMPPDEEVALNALLAAVRSGEIPERRIDASVYRILQAKQRLHLDQRRTVDIDNIASRIGTKEHWNLAKEIARNAITLVKNEHHVLPLRAGETRRVLSIVISDTDDNRMDIHRPGRAFSNEPVGAYFNQLVAQRAENTASIRLTPAATKAECGAALLRAKQSDLILLPMYVKVRASSGQIGLPENIGEFLLKARKLTTPAVAVAFGNPYIIGSTDWVDASLCAYGDSEVLVEAAVEALFGEIDVRGRLPVAIPGAYPFGAGLQCEKNRLRKDDPSIAGFNPALLRKVDEVILAAIRDSAFSAAQIAVAKDGLLVHKRSFGTFSYDRGSREINGTALFDLASVTKVIATTAAVMKLYDRGEIHLDDPVGKYLPQFARGEKASITVRHLLTHRSGFPPFRKFYEFCKSPEEELDSVYATQLVARPGDTTIYSDLGMISLGKVVERITGLSLAAYVRREFYEPLGMVNTMFNPPASLIPRTVATEYDSTWRKALVRGTVHDENAALLGGVSGHAGLFSTASDLSIFMQMLLNGGSYGGVRYLHESTVLEFTRKQLPGQDRLLGWDLKSPRGSSAGTLFSASSFGHTGFTGTSIWVDPERNLFVILLTNRVHPTRANLKISKIRPAVHDAVIRALVDESGTDETR